MNAVPRVSRSPRTIGWTTLKLGIAAGIGIGFALPVAWLVASSLRPVSETFSVSAAPSWRILWPSDFTLANFRSMVEVGFLRNVGNSLLVVAVTVVVGLLICAMAAFALAVIPMPGRDIIFGVIVVSFLVPFEAIAIPLSQQFRDWGLANTFSGLILPGLAQGLAVFSLRQFFLGIPGDLKEAAEMDGAGYARIFFRIYLPLAKPALIGSGLILFLFQWQAYLWPVLITADPEMDLAPVSIARNFMGIKVAYGTTFAEAVVLSIIPAVAILAFKRFFVASVATTGSKG